MAVDFVKDANELYKIGDSVHVRVKEFNPEGKIALTMLTAEQEAEQKAKRDARPPRDNNSGDRKSFDRNSRGSRNNRRSVDFGRAPRNRR
jgi:predicted RNA-binding protein with RPS1 domain